MKYLSISINDGIIKVAQADSSGNVEKIARVAYTSIEEAGKALKSVLMPFNRQAPVLCLIPASAATAKTIEVPSSDPEEIKSIINLQASRHTPYSREEVLISYINLGLNAINNTRLLLAIVHRNIVKERITLLEQAGLNVDKILFVPESQARFYAKALNKKDGGVIDFALNSTSYMVISKGNLSFVRHIPIGIKALVEGGDAAVKLQEELKKSMDAFAQEEGSAAPTSYFVTTARPALNTILPVLKEGLGVDFQVREFSGFIKGSGDVRKKLDSSFGDDSFLDVIAPATAVSKSEINLMPEEMILKKTVERQSKEAIKTGVCAVVIMVLVIVMALGRIYFLDTYLNKNLREQYAPQKEEVKVLEQKMNKTKLVREYIKGRMMSLDIIHELYQVTPITTYLSNIEVDDDGTVTIDGVSDSMALVYSYVKLLDDSSMFKAAKLKSATTKKDNGKDVASFEIEFKVFDPSAPIVKEQA